MTSILLSLEYDLFLMVLWCCMFVTMAQFLVPICLILQEEGLIEKFAVGVSMVAPPSLVISYPIPVLTSQAHLYNFGLHGRLWATWLSFISSSLILKTISQTSFCKIIFPILVFQIILILQIFILRIF